MIMRSQLQCLARRLLRDGVEGNSSLRSCFPPCSAFATSSTSCHSDTGVSGSHSGAIWSLTQCSAAQSLPIREPSFATTSDYQSFSWTWNGFTPISAANHSALMASVTQRTADQAMVLSLDLSRAKPVSECVPRQAARNHVLNDRGVASLSDENNLRADSWGQSEEASEMPPPHSGRDEAPLHCVKRTYQPGVLVRKRRHGFLSRLRTANGRRVLLRRKQKGRRKISA